MDIARKWESLLRHARTGTLPKRIARCMGIVAPADQARWHGATSVGQAVTALCARASTALDGTTGEHFVLTLGDGDSFHRRLDARLQRMGLAYQSLTLENALQLPSPDSGHIAIVLCACLDARQQTRAATALAQHPVLGSCPFEHIAGLGPEHDNFHRLDEYAKTDFVSPVLLDDPGPYQIYQQSLDHFEQKCGLRDYLDLYQLLKSVVERDVPGDIAEFGSFRGHSGWLIARSLQALGSDKRLYMFDTFDSFPQEEFGVDHFWSATHPVNYEQVKAKFKAMPQVTLVKGDFTQTLVDSPVTELALAFVDCDSYRATRHLLRTLPMYYLQPRGVLVCEDYGHPALLGNRVAVHEVLDAQHGWFKYFSQFSGLYIALKLD